MLQDLRSSQNILFLTEQQQQPTGPIQGSNRSCTHLGCCLLDLASGQLLVGGLSDTPGRSGLVTLLMRHQPAAVMAVRSSLSLATQQVLQLQCHEADQEHIDGMDMVGVPTAATALVYLPPSFQQHLAAAWEQLSAHVPGAVLQQCLGEQPWRRAAEQTAATAALQLERCGLAQEMLGLLQVAPLEAHAAAGANASNAGGPQAPRTVCVIMPGCVTHQVGEPSGGDEHEEQTQPLTSSHPVSCCC
jgi:hypothetical protein